LGTIVPAHADDTGAAIAGGIAGFMAGAAIGSQAQAGPPPGPPPGRFGPPPGFRGRNWRIHVAACMDQWGRRYDPRTDLVYYRGRTFPCDLGFGPPPGPPPRRFGPPPEDFGSGSAPGY
jgi:hypothetical protein